MRVWWRIAEEPPIPPATSNPISVIMLYKHLEMVKYATAFRMDIVMKCDMSRLNNAACLDQFRMPIYLYHPQGLV